MKQFAIGCAAVFALMEMTATVGYAAEAAHAIAVNLPKGPPDLPDDRLIIFSTRPDKAIYAPGEKGVLRVTLRNTGEQARSGELRVSLVRELADVDELVKRSIELAGGESKTIELPFQAVGRFGTGVLAALESDGRTQVVHDYFSVTDNFWEVGIGLRGGSSVHTGLGKQGSIAGDARRRYANWVELFFWAPCDWSKLTSPSEKWWSGQADYPEDESNLKELIDLSHQAGVKVAMYASGNAAGPFGWGLARRRPHWFKHNTFGGFSGLYVVEHLDKWNDPEWRMTDTGPYGHIGETGWYGLRARLHRLDTLDHGIDQIIQSAQHYGWDAVRFDGHYTITGSDALSTRNMRRLKKRVWEKLPGFNFGFNYGRAPAWRGGVTHEMREAMAGGGLYLQEGIRNWRYTGDQYQTWEHYATQELRLAKLVQEMGGTYHGILLQQLEPAQAYYKLVYWLIAGGHPFYGFETGVEGCPHWGAFMTRWSAMLWDPVLRRVEKPEQSVTVKGDERLWWEPFVQQRVSADGRKFVIVHLVNPSPSDEIARTSFPEPVTEPTTVALGPESGRIVRAILVRPEAVPFGVPLKIENGSRVRVPNIGYWAMVVFEIEGDFKRPAAPPKFTDPPDQQKVAVAMKAAEQSAGPLFIDPNKPASALRAYSPEAQIWETDSGFTGHGIKTIASDPDATGNLAQMRDIGKDPGQYPFMGRPYIGPIQPGRYRAVYRLKRTGPGTSDPAMLRMRVVRHPSEKLKEKMLAVTYLHTPGYARTDGAAVIPPTDHGVKTRQLTFQGPGEYHDYAVPFDLRQAARISVDVWPRGSQGDYRLYLDHVRIEPIERYGDARIAQWTEVDSKPAGLRTPEGDSPRRSLIVAGLYWQYYMVPREHPGWAKTDDSAEPFGLRIDPGFRGENRTLSYALPRDHAELYQYDVVVLANVNVRDSTFEQRRVFHDWVRDGGRLVVLGGSETLGQGGMADTYLGAMLPFELKGAREVVECDPPLALGPAAGRPYPGKPAVFWRHDLTPRAGAKVLAYAGEHPIAAVGQVGEGSVAVFVGTLLGEGHDQHRPFWASPAWPRLLAQLTGWSP